MGVAYTFVGPDRNGIVYFKNPQNARVPVFSVSGYGRKKPQLRIYRIMPNGQLVPYADATSSCFSGSIVLNIGGRQTKLKRSKEFPSPIDGEKVKWKYAGWGSKQDLYDSKQKKKLARVYHKSKKDGGLPKMEIYVAAESVMIDNLLIMGMIMYRQDQKDKGDSGAAGDVVGGVLDVVGAVHDGCGGGGGDGGGGGGGADGGGGGGAA